MTEKNYYAHSLAGRPPEKWHRLADHLKSTAERARQFAAPFGAGDWAECAALWHDLGKFLPAWQAYLLRKSGMDENIHCEGISSRPNHNTAGAVHSIDKFANTSPGRLLAYLVAGHHAGLPDWTPDPETGGDLQNRIFDTLTQRLKTDDLNIVRCISEAEFCLNNSLPKSAPLGVRDQSSAAKVIKHWHLWVRMIFSCLVDADFLDTEAFMTPENEKKRGQYPALEILASQLDQHMQKKQAEALPTELNQIRKSIFEQCRERAAASPGFFSLTVPTGGGKTLSAMAFALSHARQPEHPKSRIIVAVPYTSIIEQTAAVYREIFGKEAVLEHHSNVDPEQETSQSRLAAENWDAPIIVTTNVQLFESLLASRTSLCRKLHNIVNSVIILDEAQMLPPEYLMAILSVLRGLVDCFGVSIVTCTATQPALNGKIGGGQAVFDGLPESVEIVANDITKSEVFKMV